MTKLNALMEQLKRGLVRVLIVDDDAGIVSGMKDILENGGYTVATAASAAEARKHLKQNTFSLMIFDYSLPDDDGLKLSRDAKKLQPLMGLLLMSGHDPEQFIKKLTASGIELMRKPVEVPALLKMLERVSRQQCDILEIEWKKPVTESAAPAPERVTTPLPISPAKTLRRNIKKINYSALLAEIKKWRPAWKPAWSWAGIAFVAFVIGWIGRSILPSPKLSTPPMTLAQADSKAPLILVGDAPVEAPVPDLVPVVAAKSAPAKSARTSISRLESDNPTIRISAAKALLKENPQHAKALNTLLAILVDPLSKKHLAAIEALSTAGVSSPEVVASLARALCDDDQSVACAAATTLGRLGKSALPAVDDLVEALNYKNGTSPAVVHAAKEVLIGMGDLAIPALNKGLENDMIRPQAQEILARILPPAHRNPGPTVLSQYKAPAAEPGTGTEDLPDLVDTMQAAAAPADKDTSIIR